MECSPPVDVCLVGVGPLLEEVPCKFKCTLAEVEKGEGEKGPASFIDTVDVDLGIAEEFLDAALVVQEHCRVDWGHSPGVLCVDRGPNFQEEVDAIGPTVGSSVVECCVPGRVCLVPFGSPLEKEGGDLQVPILHRKDQRRPLELVGTEHTGFALQ